MLIGRFSPYEKNRAYEMIRIGSELHLLTLRCDSSCEHESPAECHKGRCQLILNFESLADVRNLIATLKDIPSVSSITTLAEIEGHTV